MARISIYGSSCFLESFNSSHSFIKNLGKNVESQMAQILIICIEKFSAVNTPRDNHTFSTFSNGQRLRHKAVPFVPPGGLHAFRHGRVSHLQTNNVPEILRRARSVIPVCERRATYSFLEDFARQTVERLAGESWCWTQSEKLDPVATGRN